MTQNRFLTFGGTADLAKEETLQEIRATIDNGIEAIITGPVEISDFKFTGGQTDPVEVTITGGGSSDVNLTQVGGNTVDTGSGATGTGTLRVTLANDQDASSWGNVPVAVINTPLDINKAQLNNNTITIGAGAVNSGGSTERITLANDQDTSNWDDIPVNLNDIQGAPIATDKGITGVDTIRVTLANDQDTTNWDNVPSNITAVNGNIIGGSSLPVDITQTGGLPLTLGRVPVDIAFQTKAELDTNLAQVGGVSLGTGEVPANLNRILSNPIQVAQGPATFLGSNVQRVVIANDQDTSNWRDVPVNINRQNKDHRAANVSSTNVNTSYLVCPDSDSAALDITKFLYNDLSAASTGQFTVELVSSSNNDNGAGTSGALTVQLFYYTSADISSLTNAVITLNGTTRTVTGPTNFYRLKNAFVLTTGATNSNEGTIYIFKSTAAGASIPTNEIISIIPIGYNRSNCSWWFIPYDTDNPYLEFDYLNLGISTDNAADDVLEIFTRFSSSTTGSALSIKLQENHFFQADANFLSNVNLSNLTLDLAFVAPPKGLDIIYLYTHPTAADFSVVLSLGYHYSKSPS